ncbi:hypothetical protein BKA62DRAFT_785532 [Auriculariales sp. MPI-PUGE-AT-0066]|nr:hypothetical protein BKA62DRAFT_785532 [Auriculariales sp. MPI-PUGE-AT-0066]
MSVMPDLSTVYVASERTVSEAPPSVYRSGSSHSSIITKRSHGTINVSRTRSIPSYDSSPAPPSTHYETVPYMSLPPSTAYGSASDGMAGYLTSSVSLPSSRTPSTPPCTVPTIPSDPESVRPAIPAASLYSKSEDTELSVDALTNKPSPNRTELATEQAIDRLLSLHLHDTALGESGGADLSSQDALPNGHLPQYSYCKPDLCPSRADADTEAHQDATQITHALKALPLQLAAPEVNMYSEEEHIIWQHLLKTMGESPITVIQEAISEHPKDNYSPSGTEITYGSMLLKDEPSKFIFKGHESCVPNIKFTKAEKRTLKAVNQSSLEAWPTQEASPDTAFAHRLGFVGPTTFFKHVLEPTLVLESARFSSSQRQDENFHQKLLQKLRDEPGHKAAAFQSFSDWNRNNNFASFSDNHQAVTTLNESLLFAEAADAAYRIGRLSLNKSILVRLRRCPAHELDSLRDRLVIETQSVLAKGLKTNAFTREDVVLAMVCSLLEPEDDDDKQPTTDKVIGGIIYNGPVISQMTTELQAQNDMERHSAAIEQFGLSSIQRSIKDGGIMVKLSEGQLLVNGHLTNSPLKDWLPSSHKKTRLTEHSSFKTVVEARRDITQYMMFKLIEGFFTPWAQEHYDQCKVNGLLTSFNGPVYQYFGTFMYFTAPHKDNDMGVSSGDVTNRSNFVLPDSANFFLADYKLIVELAEHARWFWRAKDTYHGTTVSAAAAAYPCQWKLLAKDTGRRVLGQTTTTSVITGKLLHAGLRVHSSS